MILITKLKDAGDSASIISHVSVMAVLRQKFDITG